MAKKTSTDAFRAPALKYQGKMQILGGPIPICEMHRPYVRKERDRPDDDVRTSQLPPFPVCFGARATDAGGAF